MIPLNAYPAFRRGTELRIKFLSDKRLGEINQIIGIFESKNKKVVTKDELIELMRKVMADENDLRVINLVYHSMLVFYEFREQKIPFRTSGESSVVISDEWDLRKLFYMWVQKRYGGFISLEERDIAIDNFCREHGIRKDVLENVVAGSILKGYKLVRRIQEPPRPHDVVAISNFLLLEKTLCLSNYAKIIFYNVERKGGFLKDLIYRSKRSRLILDFRFEGSKLICNLSGPFQLFKHPSPIYGEYISSVLMGSLCRHREWYLEASVRYRKRDSIFRINSRNPNIRNIKPPWIFRGHPALEKPFDSEVERRLFIMLKRMFPKCVIQREPEIIEGENGVLFIPDFMIKYGDKSLYIELVGFWTERYAKKKREKLDAIYNNGIENILVIADKKLSKYFKNTPYKVIYYDKQLIIARTLRTLISEYIEGTNSQRNKTY